MRKELNSFGRIKPLSKIPKNFTVELGKKRIDVTEPPTLDEVEEFWANIWENDKIHNENAE